MLIQALALFCRAQTSHPRREPGAANDVEIGEIDVPGEENGASQVLVSRNRFYRGERQAGSWSFFLRARARSSDRR
jgi:hypothetical protein